MAQTIAQVRNRALTKLVKLPLGQTPTGAQADDMENAYNQVYSRLEQLGLVSWSSTDDIPDEFVEDVVSLMAFERAEGVPDNLYVRLRDDASRAVPAISNYIAGTWENPREYTDY